MFPKLLALFILVPLVELALFLVLGSRIGLWPTLAIIIVTGTIGAWLAKSQGTRALRNFRQAIASGRLPHTEIVDGLMILIAGALLLTPGFLTDAVGFAVLIPSLRAGFRKTLAALLLARFLPPGIVPGQARSDPHPPPGKAADKVIDV
jgi:UPF0716 protein FxsA